MQDHNHHSRPIAELILLDRLPEPVKLGLPDQRFRFWMLALVAMILAMSLYILLNTSQKLERIQSRLVRVEDNDALRIRRYNQKLEDLQEKMTVFVADSVETKMKTLERNITDGTVGTQDVKILEELRGELKLLERYSAGKGGKLTDSSRMDHPRFQITPGTQETILGGDALYEVSQMKHLLYLGIASCGFAGFLVGGYWWQSASRIKRLSRDMPMPRLLAGNVTEDS